MTEQSFTPMDPFEINGTGPYPVTHSYGSKTDLILTATLDGTITVVDPADYSIDPLGPASSGDLTLQSDVATDLSGASLRIMRVTDLEQGWAGETAREVGIEAQLDWMVRAIQENRLTGQRSLRANTDQPAFDVLAGAVLGFDENGQAEMIPKADLESEAGAAAAAAYVATLPTSVRNFPTRAALKTFVDAIQPGDHENGSLFFVRQYAFVYKANATVIPDLPGLEPDISLLRIASQRHFMVDENDSAGEAAGDAWAEANNVYLERVYAANEKDVGGFWMGDPRGEGLNRGVTDGDFRYAKVLTDSAKKRAGFDAGEQNAAILSLHQTIMDDEAGGDIAPLTVTGASNVGSPSGERLSIMAANMVAIARDGASDGVNPSAGTTGGQLFAVYVSAQFPQNNDYKNTTALVRRDASGQGLAYGFKNFGGLEQPDPTSADKNAKYASIIESGGDALADASFDRIGRGTAMRKTGVSRDYELGRSGYFFGDWLQGIWDTAYLFRAPPEKARDVRLLAGMNNWSTIQTISIHETDADATDRTTDLDTLQQGDIFLARVNAGTFPDREPLVWIVHDVTKTGDVYDIEVVKEEADKLADADIGAPLEFRFYRDTGAAAELFEKHVEVFRGDWNYAKPGSTTAPSAGQINHQPGQSSVLNNAPYADSVVAVPHGKGFGVQTKASNDYHKGAGENTVEVLDWAQLLTNGADDTAIARIEGETIFAIDTNRQNVFRRGGVDWTQYAESTGDTLRISKDNDLAAVFDAMGVATTSDQSVMTREKADYRYRVHVSPKFFGAGTEDDQEYGTELQAWLDFLVANPRYIGLVDGRYRSDADLTINGPVNIQGVTWGDDSASASQPASQKCAIIGTSGVTNLITIESDTDGNSLWDVRLGGFALEGNNTAGTAIRAASVKHLSLTGMFIERFTDYGVYIDQSNNALAAFVKIHGIQFQPGSASGSRLMTAVKIEGDSTIGTTQFDIQDVTAESQEWKITGITNSGGQALITTDGAHNLEVGDPVLVLSTASHNANWTTVATVPSSTTLTVTGLAYVEDEARGFVTGAVTMDLGDIDSTYIARYQGSIYFRGDRTGEATPRRAARKITAAHLAGNLVLDEGAIVTGLNINSEASSLTVFGNASLNANLVDRTSGAQYQTETYRFSDELLLGGPHHLDGASSQLVGAIDAAAQSMPDATTSGLHWTIPAPRTWDTGRITGVKIRYASNGITGAFRAQLTVSARSAGQGLSASGAVVTAFTLAAPASATNVTEQSAAFTEDVNEGDLLVVKLERLGSDGADTSTDDLFILGVALTYQADGPNDSSSLYDPVSLKVI